MQRSKHERGGKQKEIKPKNAFQCKIEIQFYIIDHKRNIQYMYYRYRYIHIKLLSVLTVTVVVYIFFMILRLNFYPIPPLLFEESS